jgi:hypothetical protein
MREWAIRLAAMVVLVVMLDQVPDGNLILRGACVGLFVVLMRST